MPPARTALYVGLAWAVFLFALSLASIAIPRLLEGGFVGAVLGLLIATALVSFLRASLSMSRDLLAGHYPNER